MRGLYPTNNPGQNPKAMADSNILKLAPDATTPAYRTPPHNIEAECGLVGAILVNNDAFYRVSAGDLKPRPLFLLKIAQFRFPTLDIIARHRHGALPFRDLNLEIHQVLLPERHFRCCQIKLPVPSNKDPVNARYGERRRCDAATIPPEPGSAPD